MTTKTINLSYDSTNEQRIIDAMKGIYPIPFTVVDGEEVNDFTEAQWAKESVRRFVVRTVKRYENKVAIENAQVEADDEIVS